MMKRRYRLATYLKTYTGTMAALIIGAAALLSLCAGCSDKAVEGKAEVTNRIITSDTILSGMIGSLLPAHGYVVEAILPPGQCPGHYDVKLSDIEKMKKAALTVSFKGMPFMEKAGTERKAQLIVDADGRNWMAPDSYVYGLALLADELSKRFPEDKATIMARKEQAIREVRVEADLLREKIRRAGIVGKSVVASSMQKEPLEWMGFDVVAEYGRPEAMSAREVVRLAKIARDRHATLVVDNLQSGPQTGKGIAETLEIPHVILSNFPSERGYIATLSQNVDTVITAVTRK
ncbi:metal ABC transporter solute-binding protein, Zn/Mn family [Syntrophorhabdus aromaticivorans]|jgi:zinc transport system substrate-binding protein|uniref:metal ABC transporter solute-binding protein, Zn/Mn family n=1 Tax=Syntrophorhabdus aromaticivorans TaxID=328301 RepID=UPI0012EC2FC4|nr:zinc ABC transporter substrate-binding protein [Syntrophorhabdus aromaticivorans]